ncbi:MAG: VCBS repeat-containing protein [Planctomycetes bacterium]|nr:VCBS repeat-containing protein [Planctomycetota bacterium]MCB9903375.1 VCBS repeat-containing protein [Planctomycetota bacterium]
MTAPQAAAPAAGSVLLALPLLLAPCGGSSPAESEAALVPAAADAERTDAIPLPALRARLELPVTGKPEGVLLRDLDRDGRAELVAVSREPGVLTVWTRPPSGWDLLPPRVELAIGDYALGPLAFPRVERDAVLVASRSDPSLALVDALGVEGPRELARVELAAAPRAIAVGTLAGDAQASALCVDREGTLHVWSGVGSALDFAGFTSQASALCLTGDGKRLAVADRTAHEVRFFEYADGRFTLARTVTLDGIPRDVAEADVDGDGELEFLVAGGDDHLWTIEADEGAPITVRDTGDVPLRLEVVAAREPNAPDDVLLLPFYRLQVMHYVAGEAEPQRTTYAGQTPWDISSGDWNGDGAREVVVANRDAHRVSVVFADQHGAWRTDRRIATGRGPDVVVGGRFTPHGDMRLAAFCALDGTLRLHDPATGALAADPIAVGAGATNPRLVPPGLRTQGEELVWTVAHAAADGRTRAWLSALDATDSGLEAALHCELAASASDLLVVDTYAGPELWVADDHASRLHRYDAGCEPRGEIAPGSPPLSPVALAKWRESGAARVVAACRGAGNDAQLYVYSETTTLWTEAPPISAPLIPIDVEAADVNGDGAIDLCLLGKPREGDGPGAVIVFLREGDDWRETPAIETGLRPYALASADLDGDGRADLVVSAQNSHQLNLYFGRKDRRHPLERSADLGAGTGSLGLWIGDLDGDGTPEIVAANAFSNDLSVMY